MINKDFMKIGHRGACGYKPENTLSSFKKALDSGVDMIELDVYALRDKNIIVIHDDKVDRTTNGRGYVLEKTFEEIRELDAGEGEKVPTLEEVLNLIKRKVKVNIELKGKETALPVAEVIDKYVKEKGWSYDDFLVSSFNRDELKRFKEVKPEVKTGVIFSSIPINYSEIAEDLGVYSVNINKEFINQDFVDNVHKRGLKLFVWTVNNENEIKTMKQLGVDGIFSDYPDRL